MILAECYADTQLLKTLGYQTPEIHNGINEFIRLMTDPKRLKGKKAICLIDDDKKKGSYFKTLTIIKETRHSVSLGHIKNSKHYCVIIKPAIDHWLFSASTAAQLDLKKYKLPADIRQFRKLLKNRSLEKSPGYKALINDLKQKKSPRIQALINMISEAQSLK